MALYDGTVQDRYDRDWLRLNDDRKVRGMDYQDDERRERLYVDPDAVVVNPDGSVDGTVTATGDNNPAGFNQSAFEAELEYDPNA
jgi:hypothetical protein